MKYLIGYNTIYGSREVECDLDGEWGQDELEALSLEFACQDLELDTYARKSQVEEAQTLY
jgi:hypothetical protein